MCVTELIISDLASSVVVSSNPTSSSVVPVQMRPSGFEVAYWDDHEIDPGTGGPGAQRRSIWPFSGFNRNVHAEPFRSKTHPRAGCEHDAARGDFSICQRHGGYLAAFSAKPGDRRRADRHSLAFRNSRQRERQTLRVQVRVAFGDDRTYSGGVYARLDLQNVLQVGPARGRSNLALLPSHVGLDCIDLFIREG